MLTAIAIFCEDIREEKAGTHSIIGVYSDNVSVPKFPISFPKLGIYVRLSFPAGEPPQPISIQLVDVEGKVLELTTFKEEIIESASKQSLEAGATIGGLVATAMLSPCHVKHAGRFKVLAKTGNREFTCGSLNVQS